MLYLLLPNTVSGYRMKLTWGRDIQVSRWYITSGLVSELTSVVAFSVIMWPLTILLSLGCRAWSLECIQLLLLMSMDFTLASSHKNLTPYPPYCYKESSYWSPVYVALMNGVGGGGGGGAVARFFLCFHHNTKMRLYSGPHCLIPSSAIAT